MSRRAIAEQVKRSATRYLDDLQGTEPLEMHRMFLDAAERALLEVVMQRTQHNQSLAAAWLGMNRNTLRKKLRHHQLTP
jgi:Fis family transcriptional regulator